MGRALLVVQGQSLCRRRQRADVAHARGIAALAAPDRVTHHRLFLARDRATRRSALVASRTRGDGWKHAVAARAGRSAAVIRECRTTVHMGESLPGARASALALRARVHSRDLGAEAAGQPRLVYADRYARLVARGLPPRARQHAP